MASIRGHLLAWVRLSPLRGSAFFGVMFAAGMTLVAVIYLGPDRRVPLVTLATVVIGISAVGSAILYWRIRPLYATRVAATDADRPRVRPLQQLSDSALRWWAAGLAIGAILSTVALVSGSRNRWSESVGLGVSALMITALTRERRRRR